MSTYQHLFMNKYIAVFGARLLGTTMMQQKEFQTNGRPLLLPI
jgi:hypothetical protein